MMFDAVPPPQAENDKKRGRRGTGLAPRRVPGPPREQCGRWLLTFNKVTGIAPGSIIR